MERQNGMQNLKRFIALGALAALLYWDWILWGQAPNGFALPIGEGAATGQSSNGVAAFFTLGLAFEAILAAIIAWGIVLAQATEPTERELGLANWFIFILLTVAALLSELFLIGSSAPFGMPGWIFGLLVLLMSIALIYGTAAWLWTRAWVIARRKICTAVIPIIASWVITLYDTIEVCLKWSVQTYQRCTAWATRTSRECAKWGTTTSTTCSAWGTSSTRTCISWLPSWLGWICLIWNVVVQTVCLAWEVVVTAVCLLLLIVVQLVCLAFILVAILVCLLWTLIVLAISIVLTVVIGLLRIFFFC